MTYTPGIFILCYVIFAGQFRTCIACPHQASPFSSTKEITVTKREFGHETEFYTKVSGN